MVSKSILKFMRVSPKKVSIVLELIRGKNVEEAFAVLTNARTKVFTNFGKTLKICCSKCFRKRTYRYGFLYILKLL